MADDMAIGMDSDTDTFILPTRKSYLRLFDQAVSKKTTLLIEGPVGSGKTALVHHYAKIHGRTSPPQLGEQIDSKTLFGAYHCTEIPGEFVFRPSLLTKTALNGNWILLEDVGSAPSDVLGALSPLIESRKITLPGSDQLSVHPDFQLFVTLRTSDSSRRSVQDERSAYLDKFWVRLRLSAFSDQELQRVVCSLYDELQLSSRRLVEAFTTLANSTILRNSRNARFLGSRDLVRWCNRISNCCQLDDRPAIFQEAVDTLCCFAAEKRTRLELMLAVAVKLNVTKDQVLYYAEKHKPVVRILNDTIQIGRVTIKRKTTIETHLRNDRFALTRSVCTLLERVGQSLLLAEPLLLIGETGCGKTASIQFLSQYTGRTLHVVNMSQQSESTDLLGGYKPVSLQFILSPIKKTYLELFCKTFDREKNAKFLQHIHNCFISERWPELMQLMLHTTNKATKRNQNQREWTALLERLQKLEKIIKGTVQAMPFAFVEGVLLKAIRQGHWILLDEINLASAETLNCLNGLLDSTERSSLMFIEHDTGNPLEIHPDFRLIGCMNPATDVGKRNLPIGIRNRFLEIFVDELDDKDDLLVLAESYLQGISVPAKLLTNIVDFYLHVKGKSSSLSSDSWGHKPHYSLRTFCRALSFASCNRFGNEIRSLYEAFAMSFLTEVDDKSRNVVESLIQKYILGTNPTTIKQILQAPVASPIEGCWKMIEGYWIAGGDVLPQSDHSYVITPTVRKNLKDVARILSAGIYPILLQGETSVGKTSLIKYLAKLTGNTCVRINNHEHTDLQEYIGSYCSDEHGKLCFVEGPLVQAMRLGHWVILDELNLAPPDILEALNRLLDDNRELFLTETQTVVKAHPRFVLFATQNPPGVYGGRKQLSRAFRNRFVELHFSELPHNELETILQKRCSLPPSYAQRMVKVLHDLQVYRNSSGMFAGKESYMTLRDLFRWGERYRKSNSQLHVGFFDWDQYLTDQGYFVLGGRCRRVKDSIVVQEILEKHFKRKLNIEKLFGLTSQYLTINPAVQLESFEHVVWSKNLLKMAVLTGQALAYDEPVLMVGETGCGKTSLCQMLSASKEQDLTCINCHLMTEAADFLGRLRPTDSETLQNSGALFTWCEGPLVMAMKNGTPILIDEISLASDSVLERLNSVLEPERQLTLTEQSAGAVDGRLIVEAQNGFYLMATMNPGGDYGKKELSRALRNRFTEIWCEAVYAKDDLIAIVERSIKSTISLGNQQDLGVSGFGSALIEFVLWFLDNYSTILRCSFTIRDILAWVNFINKASEKIEPGLAYIHGACLVLLDGLGTNSNLRIRKDAERIRQNALVYLSKQLHERTGLAVEKEYILSPPSSLMITDGRFGMEPFFIHSGPIDSKLSTTYTFDALTCRSNVYRLLRALMIQKPILLEGPPGVGKSSLVMALSEASGHRLTRLNLSDQTDLGDLFGTDLPIIRDDGTQGFAWNDGPLLTAMKEGHWILLDEMNLASQSVLEGLNACLDHRREVFIPELSRSFKVDPLNTRFFACQNPFAQGGNRRGLPKSFVNRFSLVYIEDLSSEDEFIILKKISADCVNDEILKKMINFNRQLNEQVCIGRLWGQIGCPWEFNLRDLMRWLQVMIALQVQDPGAVLDIIYSARLRTQSDRKHLVDLFSNYFGYSPMSPSSYNVWISGKFLHIGRVTLRRMKLADYDVDFTLLRRQLKYLELIMLCVRMNWLALLVGSSGCGKSSIVRCLAALCGRKLSTFNLTSDTDALELLGSFEQIATSFKSITDKKNQLSLILERIVNQDEETRQKLRLRLETSFSGDDLRLVALDMVQFANDEVTKADIESILSNLKTESTGSMLFQWVDSPFVEAFVNGYWLVIENVNACSPAVLDRLNAALEPGGFLTLTERGMVDGSIPCFKAHPDFRLFFTMNPKYGPISRAMRNRSVEICLLDEENWFNCQSDTVDLLQQNVGLESESCTHIWNGCESVRRNGNVGPYILLESAFTLAAQPHLEVSQTVEILKEIFGHKIETHELMSTDVPSKESLRAPSVSEILSDPVKKMATYLTNAWLLAGNERNNEVLLNSPFAEVKFSIISSPVKELKVRSKILIKYEELPFKEDLKLLLSQMDTKLRQAFRDNEVPAIWDPRFYGPFLTEFFKNRNKGISDSSIQNGILFGTCVRLLFLISESLGTKSGSALYLSKRVLTKKMDSELLPSPAVKFMVPFLNELYLVMSNLDFTIDSDEIDVLLSGLFDLDLFIRCGKVRLNDRLSLVKLQLSWQWLSEPFLTVFGQQFQNRLTKKFMKSVASICEIWSLDPVLDKLFRSVRHSLPFCRPFTMETLSFAHSVWPSVHQLRCVERNIGEKSDLPESLVQKRLDFISQLSEGSFSEIEMDFSPSIPSTNYGTLMRLTFTRTRDLLCFPVEWNLYKGNVTEDCLNFLLNKQTMLSSSLIWKHSLQWINWDSIFLKLHFLNSETSIYGTEGGIFKPKGKQAKFVSLAAFASKPFVESDMRLHHCVFPNVTQLVGSLFERIGFSLNLADSCVPLKELKEFIGQINGISAALWIAGLPVIKATEHIMTQVKNLIGELVGQILALDPSLFVDDFGKLILQQCLLIDRSLDDSSDSQVLLRVGSVCIQLGIIVCTLTTPPKQMLDPVLQVQAEKMLLQYKLDYVQSEIDILNRYSVNVSATELVDFDCLQHSHPYIRVLYETRNSLRERLSTVKEEIQGARPDGVTFERLGAELQSFIDMSRTALEQFSSITYLSSLSDNVSALSTALARLQGWIASAEKFTISLCDDFFGFPDVLTPYLTGLMTTQIGANLLSALINDKLCNFEFTSSAGLNPDKGLQFAKICMQHHLTDIDDDLLFWALSQTSPLPSFLQYQLAKQFMDSKSSIVLSWLLRLWEKLKPSDDDSDEPYYEYKKKSTETDSEEVDPDSEEMLRMFPDYSIDDNIAEENEVSTNISERNITCEDLADLLHLLINKSTSPQSGDRHSVGLWMMQSLQGVTTAGQIDWKVMGSHLLALRKLRDSQLQSSVNVYYGSSLKDISSCCELVHPLIAAAQKLEHDWPEMSVLRAIQSKAIQLLSFPVRTPLMKLCAHLESLLTECEQWESVASRAVTLETWITPLRYLLVEWRKREINCWEQLLDDVQSKVDENCLIASFPLASACEGMTNTPTESSMFLSVVLEWLLNSAIGDFESRLDSVRLCEKWLEYCSTEENLTKQLTAVRLYFTTFSDLIAKQKTSLRQPIEKELKDFVKVVKYQDLNLWSVKLSAQKAHQQLFKLVKKYKDCLLEPAKPLFEQLLPIPHLEFSQSPSNFVSNFATQLPGELEHLLGYNKRLCQLATGMQNFLTENSCLDSITSLNDLSCQISIELQDSVKYTGTKEEMEKQQGRALQLRQKAVSQLLKAIKEAGLPLRRGLKLDNDTVTNELMFNLQSENSDLVKRLRLSAAHRTIFLSAAAKPHQQLNPRLVNAFRGFGNLIPNLLHSGLNSIIKFSKGMGRLQSGFEVMKAIISDLRCTAQMDYLTKQPQFEQELDIVCNSLKQCNTDLKHTDHVWSCCPDLEHAEQWQLSLFQQQSSPISNCTTNDPEFLTNIGRLRSVLDVITSVSEQLDLVKACKFEKVIYVPKERLEQLLAELDNLDESVIALGDLALFAKSPDDHRSNCFDEGIRSAQLQLDKCLRSREKIKQLLSNRKKARKDPVVLTDDVKEIVDSLLLLSQKVFKTMDIPAESMVEVYFGIQKLLTILNECNLEKIYHSMESFLRRISLAGDGDALLMVIEPLMLIGGNTLKALDFLANYTNDCLVSLSQFYLHSIGLMVKLLQQGFVDPIPQIEQGDSSEAPTKFQDFEQAGLGEGEGARDVTEEIEDMGQVEGLKNDQQETKSDEQEQSKDDVEKPIEMEDDFDGLLEDMKLDENEEDSGSEDGEKEDEAKPDWQMGETDKPEEEQLDPKLWDDKEQSNVEQNELSDDTIAAQEQQNELTAKDENATEMEMEKLEPENEELPEDQGELENMDLRSDEESGNDESDMEGEEKTTENIEQTVENMEQEEDRPEDEFCEEKTEDLSEQTVNSVSETGAGKSKDTNEAVQSKEENKGENEKNENEERMENDGEKEEKMNEGNEKETNEVTENASETLRPYDSGGQMEPNRQSRPKLVEEEKKTLGEKSNELKKRQIEKSDETEMTEDKGPNDSNRYSHAPNLNEQYKQTIDAATLEEAQKSVECEQIDLDNDEKQEEIGGKNELKESNTDQTDPLVTSSDQVVPMEIEDEQKEEIGEQKQIVTKLADSTIHTVMDFFDYASQTISSQKFTEVDFTVNDITDSPDSCRIMWNHFTSVTQPLAAELTENLRLILEPTQASKLEGDYRTGKRLNIRKLIPYVASNFRKNRIWLRRTKKAKRDYQILLAVDDSSSMHDNKTREMAYESLALLESALRHLEVGQLGVCSFGENVKMLHELNDQFTDQSGANILSRLNFEQKKTSIAELLDFVVSYFGQHGGPTSSGSELPAQLLVIISDGRGLFVDGMERARTAVQTAISARIFTVFIVMDNPEHKDSILDIKVPVFRSSGPPEIHSYMDYFPFPFYVILRNISALPAVVGDALRQWFEIVTNKS